VTRPQQRPLQTAITLKVAVALSTVTMVACAPERFRPSTTDYSLVKPDGAESITRSVKELAAPKGYGERFAKASEPAPTPTGTMQLRAVIESVTSRYPPYLSALLERDLASGRLQTAMGSFDTQISAKVGGRLEGFYESTFAQGLLEQPLATGDTIYGGYRVSDGLLPDYYKDRTQDDGEFVFGGRFPLMQNRSIDKRRAGVRKAEIDVLLAEPKILGARIEYVRRATAAYYKWTNAGLKLDIARELLRLASDRQDGLARGVERNFLAPIALTDNESLIAKRRIYVAQAERGLQAASLGLSLYLRDAEDRPLVLSEANLPEPTDLPPVNRTELEDDMELAAKQRPDLRELHLQIAKAETDRALAENQVLPEVNLIVEAASSLSNGPYKDREDLELFVGGELKLPLQRRGARGRLEQATAMLSRLTIEQRFARDRIVNEILDARSALQAIQDQLGDAARNVELTQTLVTAEQRAFDLGLSDLLRVQFREVKLADARMLAVEARLAYRLANADYRAALGYTEQE
jgi:outer membrane protein TolC